MKTTAAAKVRHIHQTLSFGEHTEGEYSICDRCGSKTMLIVAPCYWTVDQEAFAADERTDNDESVPREVEVYEEISAHFCNTCNRITSLSFNATERS